MRPFFIAAFFLYDSPVHLWQLANSRVIRTSEPALMAILNATPDSFSDGGKCATVDSALHACALFLEQGAAIIDIGGESTRPGAAPVDIAEQIRRTVPIITSLRARREFDPMAISIDTTRAEVARAALEAGADAINDVSGLHDDRESMLGLLASTHAGYVLMHRLVAPAKDRYSDRYAKAPMYNDVVSDVRSFLQHALGDLVAQGIDERRVLLDPGLGFGKSVEQNCDLIRGTSEFTSLGRPVLSGLSRKSFVGRLAHGRDSDPGERLEGTLALSALHLYFGARVFRVHDVGACMGALRATSAFLPANPAPRTGI